MGFWHVPVSNIDATKETDSQQSIRYLHYS